MGNWFCGAYQKHPAIQRMPLWLCIVSPRCLAADMHVGAGFRRVVQHMFPQSRGQGVSHFARVWAESLGPGGDDELRALPMYGSRSRPGLRWRQPDEIAPDGRRGGATRRAINEAFGFAANGRPRRHRAPGFLRRDPEYTRTVASFAAL
ncbi:hypothetical protein MRB53_041340 [Persea americana]|nr:hypothetical protein MRB53_041340 [Persea americana]